MTLFWNYRFNSFKFFAIFITDGLPSTSNEYDLIDLNHLEYEIAFVLEIFELDRFDFLISIFDNVNFIS